MRLPLNQARFLKSELRRKALADQRVKALNILAGEQDRQLQDYARYITSLESQKKSLQTVVVLDTKERLWLKEQHQQQIKQERKKGRQKTVVVGGILLVLGFLLGSR